MRYLIVQREKKAAAPVAAQPAPTPARGAKRVWFDASLDLSQGDQKTFKVVKDAAGEVLDYRDVTIKGYLSTFQATTPADRDGDYVVKGAFAQTIPKFMANPVLLVNHSNNVKDAVGRFTTVREDEAGLYVEATISNSPAEATKDIRFKVAEGILRCLSMGGLFHYEQDGRGIFRVDLWEGSLTPIPANPDAMVSTRALTLAESTIAKTLSVG